MPKPRYERLKSQFDDAIAQSKILEFIKVLEETNKASPVDYFFRACAYDIVGEFDKAYKHYALVVQLISAKDKHAQEMVKTIYQFIQKTGRTELNDIIVKRALPGAKVIKKQTPSEPKATTPSQLKATPATPNKPKATPPPPPKISPEQALRDAEQLCRYNRFNKALELLEYAYGTGFRSVKLLHTLAMTQHRLNKHKEAIGYLDMGLSLYKNIDDVMLFLNHKAQIYASQQLWYDALRAYEEQLKLKLPKERIKSRRFILMRIIFIYRKLELPQQVDRVLKQLRTEFPNDTQAIQFELKLNDMSSEWAFREGKVAFDNNNLNRAFELLKYAYDAGLRSIQLIYILAQSLYGLDKYQDAKFYIDVGIELYPSEDNLILFLNEKARIYASLQQWGDAVKVYEEIFKLQSDKDDITHWRDVLIQLINIYNWQLGQPQKAERLLKKLSKKFPEDARRLQLQTSPQLPNQRQLPTVAMIIDSATTTIETKISDNPLVPSIQIPQNEEEKNRKIEHICEEIEEIIFAINETVANHEKPMIFTPTNKDGKIYKYLKTPAYSRETFIHFASHIYLLIFERTTRKTTIHAQKLGLLPSEFQRKHLFVREVDAIRHAYGNAHITEPETFKTVRDSIPVGRVLERYLGSKNSPKDNQFIDLQYGLLHSLRDYLNDLHYYVAQNV